MGEDDDPNIDIDENIGGTIEERNNPRPKRANAGAGIEQLEMSFGGKEDFVSNQQHVQNGLQFTMKGMKGNTDIKPLENQMYICMAINVVFTQVARYSRMAESKRIKIYGKRSIAAMF